MEYRPAGGIVRNFTLCMFVLIAALIVSTVGALVVISASLAEEWAMDRLVLSAVGYSAMVGAVAMIGCIVLFCVWIHRANRNARALGATGMHYTPGWSAGWFFVPIANLFKPYLAVKEIYQASDPGSTEWGWSGARVPAFVGIWWFAWIGGRVLERVQRVMIRSDAGFAVPLLVASMALTIVAGILAIRLLRDVHQRQEAKAAQRVFE